MQGSYRSFAGEGGNNYIMVKVARPCIQHMSAT